MQKLPLLIEQFGLTHHFLESAEVSFVELCIAESCSQMEKWLGCTSLSVPYTGNSSI